SLALPLSERARDVVSLPPPARASSALRFPSRRLKSAASVRSGRALTLASAALAVICGTFSELLAVTAIDAVPPERPADGILSRALPSLMVKVALAGPA